MDKHFGHRLRILHWCADQAMTNALASMDLTAAQGHIMGYLARREEAPCSRDIEEAFHLSHPTVSGLLSRLEKKHFIEFRPDEQDRRCKRIYILPKGKACNEMMYNTILETEAKIVEGFNEEEKEQFLTLLQRATENMCGQCCHKEDKKL